MYVRTRFPGVYESTTTGNFSSWFYEKQSGKKVIAVKNEDCIELAAFELHVKLHDFEQANPKKQTTYKNPKGRENSNVY